MKKLLIAILSALLLLSLVSCGEKEVTVTLKNNLGIDITHVEVYNENGEGMTLPAGIPLNGSDTVTVKLDGGEGYVEITLTDSRDDKYTYNNVYLYEGIELLAKIEDGQTWIEYTYDGTDQTFSGEYSHIPTVYDQLNAQLKGLWLYSDGGNNIYFDGEDGFIWNIDEETVEGVYSFNGETVTFYSDGAESYAGFNEDGNICVEGDAGSFYYFAD